MNRQFREKSWFSWALRMSSIGMTAIILSFFGVLVYNSLEAFNEFGWQFIFNDDWTPNWEDIGGTLGALPFMVGTLLTSLLALGLSAVFSIAIAIFLGEFYRKGLFSALLTSLVELLAGIPSVIYGFWAFFVLVPQVQSLKVALGYESNGFGIFTAALVLSVMIIPYSASLAREVMNLVPQGIKASAYALGATRYEVIRDIILPYCRSGIMAGFILSLGRALGETMAVTMVIGNTNVLPTHLFSNANTLSSLLVNEFAEASDDIYLSALVYISLILLIMTTLINMVGKFIIRKFSINMAR